MGTVETASHDLSMMGLFMQADIIVKCVMIGLVFASVICWAIIANRVLAYGRAKRAIKKFDKAFAAGASLEELRDKFGNDTNSPVMAVLNAGLDEWNRSAQQDRTTRDGLKTRLELALDMAVNEQSAELEKRLGFLATIGSAAPFIGLFGTVWGIMNAFTAIASAENTSLAVVAPGIAEALFATALGLVAAIPAVMAYNKLSADAAKLIFRAESFANRLTSILSRRMDAGSTDTWQ